MKATDSLDIDSLSNSMISHVTMWHFLGQISSSLFTCPSKLVNLDRLDRLDPSNIDFARWSIFAHLRTRINFYDQKTKCEECGWFDMFWCFYMSYMSRLGFWMQPLLDKTPSLILRHVKRATQKQEASASLSPSDPIVASDTDCTDRPIEGPVARDLWHWKTR